MAAQTDLSVTLLPAGKVLPYARNPMAHDEAQVKQIAASIREFGFVNPVLVDEQGTLIAGHGRTLAAEVLGMAEIPAITLEGLTDAQKKALRIADNQLARNAKWDAELVKLELDDLGGMDFDLDLLGFSSLEMDGFMQAGDGAENEDDVPDEPAEPVVEAGQLWRLGPHRLLCGDATSAEDVAKLLAGVEPHLMVTDPPYGVNYEPGWRSSLDQWNRATQKVLNDNTSDWQAAYALFPGHVIYCWSPGGSNQLQFAETLIAAGFEIRTQIIWAKPHFCISRGNYHAQHEPCWYAVRKGKAASWSGDRKQSTLWHIDNALFQGRDKNAPDNVRAGHSTQKPVECMRRPMLNNSSPGQAVYDPFMGSGTTIIAAETTGRVAYGLEINPAYVEMAIERWQDFAGQIATLAGEDTTLEQLRATQVAA